MNDECEIFPTLNTEPFSSKFHILTVESDDADISSLYDLDYAKSYESSRDQDI